MPATIVAQWSIDDGTWHSIKWTRSHVNAQLFVDDTLIGSSDKTACQLNVSPPYYFGGTDPAHYGRIIQSIVSARSNVHERVAIVTTP